MYYLFFRAIQTLLLLEINISVKIHKTQINFKLIIYTLYSIFFYFYFSHTFYYFVQCAVMYLIHNSIYSIEMYNNSFLTLEY